MKFNRVLPLLAGSLTLLGMAAILPARANVFEYQGSKNTLAQVRPNEAPTRPDSLGADRDELDSNDATTTQFNNMQPGTMQPGSSVIQRVGNSSSVPGMYGLSAERASYDSLLPPDKMGFDRDELDSNDLRMNLMDYSSNQSNSQRNVIQRQGSVNNMPGMSNQNNMSRPGNSSQPNSVRQPGTLTQPDSLGADRDELDRNDMNNMRPGTAQPGSNVIRREGEVNQAPGAFDYDLDNLSQPNNIYRPGSSGAGSPQMNNMNMGQPGTPNNNTLSPSGQDNGNN